NEDGGSNDNQKAPRGLLSAAIVGDTTAGGPASLKWRIQGGFADPVRGPQNNGGLGGERAGYSLPGYPDGGWANVTLPLQDSTPGVAWYRTTFRLDLPQGQDVPVGLRFTDDPAR